MQAGVEDRIADLGCWAGRIEIEPLKGGISNESYLVSDGLGRHVVRFGKDYPFHHVLREREIMTARAAHEAGFGPKVEHSAPGVMVSAFLAARTFAADDVRANAERVAALLRRFHEAMPAHVTGPGFMFWPFHVIRDYARTLEAGKSRMSAQVPRYLELCRVLEAAQTPLPIVFAHNDLLPANILDDGERLWLIDFEYAGFSTAMFDLAGTTSNAGFFRRSGRRFSRRLFRRHGADRNPPLAFGHAMRLAAARGDVEHGVRNPSLRARCRLRELHGRQSGAA